MKALGIHILAFRTYNNIEYLCKVMFQFFCANDLHKKFFKAAKANYYRADFHMESGIKTSNQSMRFQT